MYILKGIILRNVLDKECAHIARQAADEIVALCMEKKEGQLEGERSRRISDALSFFERLPCCTHLFCKQVNELEAKKVSKIPLITLSPPANRRSNKPASSIRPLCSSQGSQNPNAKSSPPKRGCRL